MPLGELSKYIDTEIERLEAGEGTRGTLETESFLSGRGGSSSSGGGRTKRSGGQVYGSLGGTGGGGGSFGECIGDSFKVAGQLGARVVKTKTCRWVLYLLAFAFVLFMLSRAFSPLPQEDYLPVDGTGDGKGDGGEASQNDNQAAVPPTLSPPPEAAPAMSPPAPTAAPATSPPAPPAPPAPTAPPASSPPTPPAPTPAADSGNHEGGEDESEEPSPSPSPPPNKKKNKKKKDEASPPPGDADVPSGGKDQPKGGEDAGQTQGEQEEHGAEANSPATPTEGNESSPASGDGEGGSSPASGDGEGGSSPASGDGEGGSSPASGDGDGEGSSADANESNSGTPNDAGEDGEKEKSAGENEGQPVDQEGKETDDGSTPAAAPVPLQLASTSMNLFTANGPKSAKVDIGGAWNSGMNLLHLDLGFERETTDALTSDFCTSPIEWIGDEVIATLQAISSRTDEFHWLGIAFDDCDVPTSNHTNSLLVAWYTQSETLTGVLMLSENSDGKYDVSRCDEEQSDNPCLRGGSVDINFRSDKVQAEFDVDVGRKQVLWDPKPTSCGQHWFYRSNSGYDVCGELDLKLS